MRFAKDIIQEQFPPFVDVVQISDLFKNTYGSSNPVNIVQNFTSNFTALVDKLIKIYPHFIQSTIILN